MHMYKFRLKYVHMLTITNLDTIEDLDCAEKN